MEQAQKKSVAQGFKERYIPMKTFQQNMSSYYKPKGPQLFDRCQQMVDYIDQQRKAQIWLYNRKMLTGVSTQVLGVDQNSNVIHGINFASADYLGLAQSELAKEAAITAAKQFGVNSAGSPLAFGTTKYFGQLIEELKQFWGVKNLMIYSAGWLAGFGAIKGLVKEYDHVIIDNLSHNCLQEGAKAATQNVHKTPHLDIQAVQKKILQIREKDKAGAILVVTQGLFSMDSDSPDLKKLQKITKAQSCFLLIDCAHDFGCMGQKGRGVWQQQGLDDLSNVILLGTGSKTLSTNIGFVGCNNYNVIQYLKIMSTAYMFTNAINPVQAATSLANLRILSGFQGKLRRQKVIQNYKYLRTKLQQTGNKIFGNPCPILPLYVGNQYVCRMVARLMLDDGVHVNGIQFPVVSVGQARLRVNLMPQHTREMLDLFVSKFNKAKKSAQVIVRESYAKYQSQKQRSKL